MTHDTRYATAYTAIVIVCPFCLHLAGLAVHPKRVAVGDEVFCCGCLRSLVIESAESCEGGWLVGVRRRVKLEGVDGVSRVGEVGEESKGDRGTEAASGAD